MKTRPEQGELVIATVKKIYPYGAFCSLDEYNGLEAFLHVSEIAPRWIKNIHEHVREGQKVIAQVYRYLPDKNQIDLTVKRISESDKVWKREHYRRSNRAKKLLEIAAKRLKKDKVKFFEEAGTALEKAFGSVYEGLEALSFDTDAAKGKLGDLNEKSLAMLEAIAKENIKPQKVNIGKTVIIECFDPDGVDKIKAALNFRPSEKVKMDIKYLGAPSYKVNVESEDYKTAEKEIARLLEHIRKSMGKGKHKVELKDQ